MRKGIPDETRMTERVRWFDRFLSRATLLLVFGFILLIFAIPTLVSIGVAGFGWATWDSLSLPDGMRIPLGILIVLYLVLEACVLFGVGKKPKKQNCRRG